ncbi:hypothetical protein A3B36_02085 [Candidatus Uhrbacteria bacterium RIFCSPLOWO2_01_FULL_55_36]|uniref:Uncharacterized protein n=1 Tax=Candidatus Uhrbacteria bacterium RIFCSPLOWO2_01_FULL_55_36 TaxID=1802404 RepID=A0A1F7V226_9BACT|nr:MAG: hypothetical protein A3B36_02085 [Candidatus Uhrbacteria bacterium RIFCSPLOWO2_01_FULL_55_36]
MSIPSEEVSRNILYRDILSFLRYVTKRTPYPQLTETGNLNLRSLREVNDTLIRKQPMEDRIGDKVFPVRSEHQLWYLRTIDALLEAAGLTMRTKRRLLPLLPRVLQFDGLDPQAQFLHLWRSFARQMEWPDLAYWTNDARIAGTLQLHQDMVWRYLHERETEVRHGPFSYVKTLDWARETFKIRWVTAHGDNADLARSGISRVLFHYMLVPWGFARYDTADDTCALTSLGREVIALEASGGMNPAT